MSTYSSADGPERSTPKQRYASEYEDVILDPLPPQDRTSTAGRAMLGLARFVNRVLSAGGAALLIVSGATNFGAILLALLLHRASPGNAVLPLVLAGISTFLWVGLAATRWAFSSGNEPAATEPGSAFRRSSDGPASIGGSPNSPTDSAGPQQSPRSFSQSAWYSDGQEPGEADLRDAAPNHGSAAPVSSASASVERALRAVNEFGIRRRTFLPRVEAAQRSARILVGVRNQPRWLTRDLRPLVFFFVAVAVSVPVMMLTGAITLISLLVATSPI